MGEPTAFVRSNSGSRLDLDRERASSVALDARARRSRRSTRSEPAAAFATSKASCMGEFAVSGRPRPARDIGMAHISAHFFQGMV